MSGSGSAQSSDETFSITSEYQKETNEAVASIINLHQGQNDNDTMETNTDNPLKRKQSLESVTESLPPGDNRYKKQNTRRKRQYNLTNEGPFEVIVQSRDKNKINPFAVGKIIKNNHEKIDFIKRAGKNVVVTCKDAHSANQLVDSPHLVHYNVFIPASRVEVTGVIFVEPDINEDELINEGNCVYHIVHAKRITRYINREVINTNFMMITFDSDKLPEYIYLNYVRMPVKQYMRPIRQCYNCFRYGHVAKSPCDKTKTCRDCSQEYHEGPCTTSIKCANCEGPHPSNSKTCPEYIRQKKINERMNDYKEDYYTASQNVSKLNNSNKSLLSDRPRATYAEKAGLHSQQIMSPTSSQYQYSETSTDNKYLPLQDEYEHDISPNSLPVPYNTKPKSTPTPRNLQDHTYHKAPRARTQNSSPTTPPPVSNTPQQHSFSGGSNIANMVLEKGGDVETI
ncbi:uncharacterized protein LOC129003318 [Macrosteles quadrilineatus]|uniref:uncharacterized protein LOC129003318 n=1 Tax=Macrosteles quadrilineatus TaxID=74068 RepID=UPI0023E1035A|nr:uncharacterized protein LOC129003318 [Macrosteles quadrilineatus]